MNYSVMPIEDLMLEQEKLETEIELIEKELVRRKMLKENYMAKFDEVLDGLKTRWTPRHQQESDETNADKKGGY